jgi:molybdopterin-guanine dinucleotide biosynthesis protein A
MIISGVPRNVSAAILAGGRARRFGGADKASLIVGGARIIDRQLAALETVADDIRIVANEPDRYAALGVRVIPDQIAGAGPLGGLHAALADAVHGAVVVLGCDLPFVTPALLRTLVIEFGTGEEVDAVVPRPARGLEPLCAIYAKRCADQARRRIDRGDLALRGLLDDVRVRVLGPDVLAPYEDESVFLNVNTPHDYARATGRVELNEKPYKDRITE